MLKKLVKYGNSNALVLDKAILELLNIEEGSIIKISTDGRSIILTPQQPATTLPVNETVTSADALHRACIETSMKTYTNLDPEVRKNLEEELVTLMESHKAAIIALASNEAFKAEAELAKIACGSDQAKFLELHTALKKKYAPTLAEHSKRMLEFDKKCHRLSGMELPDNMEEKQLKISQGMKAVFEKHQKAMASMGEIMSSPEYQHAAQLLTEKFQNDHTSPEFITAMKTLTYEFCPEMEIIHQELEASTKKHVKA